VKTSGSRLDREVRELLRDDPELLALAERIASLRPEEIDAPARAPRGRRRLSDAVRALVGTARRPRSR
jgi:hypothetical protein